MTVVMAVGVFDILHLGHLYYLEEAKKLGDYLVVVIARDSTVKKYKYQPVNDENARLKIVSSLTCVDKALLGYENDSYKIVEELKPDIIAIGYDQIYEEKDIKNELQKRNINAKIVRLKEYGGGLNSTRKIIKKIIDWYMLKMRLESVEGKKCSQQID